jgi:epoxyqueuosine reductase QueG
MKQIAKSEATVRDGTTRIRDILEQEGACCVGFADISSLGLPMTREYPFGICFAIRHDDTVIDQLPDDELWRQMSLSITEKARYIYQTVQGLLESWGYHHRRIPSTTREDELPDPGEELPQKTLATLSGLGWVGKSSLLISPRFGPRIRLGTLLTDMPLKNDTPVVLSQCGDCRACVDACPVGAIKGNPWSQTTPRSELLNLSRCYDYLWSAKPTLGHRQTCGICLKVCPVGREK